MKGSFIMKTGRNTRLISLLLTFAVLFGLAVSVSAADVSRESGTVTEEDSQVTDPGQIVVDTALQYLGVPYVWGGTSPAGFDCSGFVQYVLDACGYPVSRLADTQYDDGEPVDYEDLQPGDLVFFERTYDEAGITHVGIYIGDGTFVHAGGGQVKITSLEDTWYASRYYGACRIISDDSVVQQI